MKRIFIFLAFVSTMMLQAQEKNTNPIKDRFQLGIRFKGDQKNIGYIPDIAARLKIMSINKLKFNLGLNVGVTNYNYTEADAEFVFNPNITTEFDVFKSGLRPYLGLGYVFWKHDAGTVTGSGASYKLEVENKGFTVDPGVRLYFAHIFYADAGFRFTFIEATGVYPYFRSDTRVGEEFTLGIGFHF